MAYVFMYDSNEGAVFFAKDRTLGGTSDYSKAMTFDTAEAATKYYNDHAVSGYYSIEPLG